MNLESGFGEAVRHFGPDLVATRPDRRSKGGEEPLDAHSAVAGCTYRRLRNASDRAPPAGVHGGRPTGLRFHQ